MIKGGAMDAYGYTYKIVIEASKLVYPGQNFRPSSLRFDDYVRNAWILINQTTTSSTASYENYVTSCAPSACVYDVYSTDAPAVILAQVFSFVGGAASALRVFLIMFFSLFPLAWFGSTGEIDYQQAAQKTKLDTLQAELAYKGSVGPYCLPLPKKVGLDLSLDDPEQGPIEVEGAGEGSDPNGMDDAQSTRLAADLDEQDPELVDFRDRYEHTLSPNKGRG
jgi:hypothetical protein